MYLLIRILVVGKIVRP